MALASVEEDDCERAAVQLAAHPDEPVEQLRRVLQESPSPQVRAAVAAGLGRLRDWESMPELVRMLESQSMLERGRAAVAVKRILGHDFGYRAEDPKEKRLAAIELIKTNWPIYKQACETKQRMIQEKAS